MKELQAPDPVPRSRTSRHLTEGVRARVCVRERRERESAGDGLRGVRIDCGEREGRVAFAFPAHFRATAARGPRGDAVSRVCSATQLTSISLLGSRVSCRGIGARARTPAHGARPRTAPRSR